MKYKLNYNLSATKYLCACVCARVSAFEPYCEHVAWLVPWGVIRH